MQVRKRIAAFLLFGALGVAGCASAPAPAPAQPSLAGTWEVVSLDGNPLPWEADEWALDDDYACTTTIHSMQWTFVADGTWNAALDDSVACTGEEPERETTRFGGTYSVNGTTITMYDAEENDPVEAAFTFSGSTLTLTETDPDGETTVVVLRRR